MRRLSFLISISFHCLKKFSLPYHTNFPKCRKCRHISFINYIIIMPLLQWIRSLMLIRKWKRESRKQNSGSSVKKHNSYLAWKSIWFCMAGMIIDFLHEIFIHQKKIIKIDFNPWPSWPPGLSSWNTSKEMTNFPWP